MRRLICNIQDSGVVDAKFEGSHLNKRELLRLLKAIRLEYRRGIRLYRSELMAKQSKQRVDAEEEAIKVDGESKKIDEEFAVETSKAKADNVGVKEDGVRITKTEEGKDSRGESSGAKGSTVKRNTSTVGVDARAVRSSR